MKYVRVTKLRPAENPAIQSGDFGTHRCGQLNALSLPAGYEVEGWMVAPPVPGQPVQILRRRRNGVEVAGVFWSSDVVSVGDRGFSTANSVYLVMEAEAPANPDAWFPFRNGPFPS